MVPQNICFCIISAVTVIFIVSRCNGWKAVPANQAVYALRQMITFADEDEEGYASTHERGIANLPDELLPRKYLHSNFKFGWCAKDSTSRVFLRKSVNMSFTSYGDTLTRYIYLLDHRHTTRFQLQCVMLKMYVPRKYLFKKSRFPMYYCQGTVFFVMLNTIQKIAIHEFYIQTLLRMPCNFVFEFYHPIIV